MGDQLWGDGGEPINWLIDWKNLQEHQLVDLVVDVLSFDKEVILGLAYPCNTKIRLVGDFEQMVAFPSFAVFGAIFNGEKGILQLTVSKDSRMLGHHPIEMRDLTSLVELCSGMGWSTYGFQHVGVRSQQSNVRWVCSVASNSTNSFGCGGAKSSDDPDS